MDDVSLSVQCPQCGSPPNMPCTDGPSMKLRPAGTHQVRRDQYVEEWRLRAFGWALDRVMPR